MPDVETKAFGMGDERAARENADRERLEKQTKYRDFVESYGYNESTKGEFITKKDEARQVVELYKKIGTFSVT
jgi:hypothetical protein